MVANTMILTGWTDGSDQKSDEVAILQRIVKKDEVAFESLYKRYHPKLFRFVQRMINDPYQVEEVVSDTLYTVWKGAEKFQYKSKVSTWIFSIGYRTALKAIRTGNRHSRYTRSGDNPDAVTDPSKGSDPAADTELRESISQLSAALKSLSTEQRAVVELTALGWSYIEISQIVDCPINTVKTRMFSARKKLRTNLEVL